VEADIRKTEEALERYFLAFEAGTMTPEDWRDRVDHLQTRLAGLTDRVRPCLPRPTSEGLGLAASSRVAPTLDLALQSCSTALVKTALASLTQSALALGSQEIQLVLANPRRTRNSSARVA